MYKRQPEDYDRIITGDLGEVGQHILFDMMKEKGFDIEKQHMDCGIEIYDKESQDTHAGGSGCGCSAVTFASYILPKIEKGEWKRVLFVPTGALLSKVSYNEGKSVPGIAPVSYTHLILEMILGRPIAKIRVHAEHTILYSSDFRSVRLDIYASDEVQVEYDIEMQNEDEHNLPKRSRYYQGEMDITSLKPGQDFKSLRPCFIIFICTFDPFGKGLYRYT